MKLKYIIFSLLAITVIIGISIIFTPISAGLYLNIYEGGEYKYATVLIDGKTVGNIQEINTENRVDYGFYDIMSLKYGDHLFELRSLNNIDNLTFKIKLKHGENHVSILLKKKEVIFNNKKYSIKFNNPFTID